MRGTLVFSGTSCPALTGKICGNLGMAPAEADLSQFSNVSYPMTLLLNVMAVEGRKEEKYSHVVTAELTN